MIKLLTILLSCSSLVFSQQSKSPIKISSKIFKRVDFSDQYKEGGSLIRNVNFQPVNDLIPILEERYKELLKGRKLQDRGEAHITVITPPEAKTNFLGDGRLGIEEVLPTDEMISIYKNTIQSARFTPICIGKQSSNDGKIVFFLVVKSEGVMKIRNEIYNKILDADRADIPFHPTKDYYPHITIGYIKDDVHGVDKGENFCVEDIVIVNE